MTRELAPDFDDQWRPSANNVATEISSKLAITLNKTLTLGELHDEFESAYSATFTTIYT
jgi:hypothetical protein